MLMLSLGKLAEIWLSSIGARRIVQGWSYVCIPNGKENRNRQPSSSQSSNGELLFCTFCLSVRCVNCKVRETTHPPSSQQNCFFNCALLRKVFSGWNCFPCKKELRDFCEAVNLCIRRPTVLVWAVKPNWWDCSMCYRKEGKIETTGGGGWNTLICAFCGHVPGCSGISLFASLNCRVKIED